VALFNYVTDPSGASSLTVSIAIGGGSTGQPNATPSEVKVKYLAANSVAQKGNFTWAGQVSFYLNLRVGYRSFTNRRPDRHSATHLRLMGV
jgi:hypothetical protein